MNLTEVLEAEGLNDFTYKGRGTDKNTHHSFVSGFYEKEFEKYRDRPIRMLEIGVFNGGSAALWSRYFSNADIYAVDLVDRIHDDNRNLKGVRYYFGDAYHPDRFSADLRFDIIIDDGPHTPLSQVQAICYYLKHLNPGGVMVIEDIGSPDLFPVLEYFVPQGYQTERVDLRHVKNRFDDLLFVIRAGT